MLTDSRYQYGSYTRRHFAGDILYGVVSFADLDALISPQFALVKDRWAERRKARLDPDLLREYTRQLTDAVRAAAVDDAFFEQTRKYHLIIWIFAKEKHLLLRCYESTWRRACKS